jgi:ADP-heptose:LPS heptosyltransferase
VLPQPQWDGSDLRGKTILLHNEQGLGDAIQFIRYLPMIAARGGRIILACDPVLMRLFQQLPSIAQFIPLGGVLPHLDVHCAVTTLPLVFKTDLDSIPAVLPLRADPKLAEAWKQKMSSDRSIRKIGLVWSGSPRHPNDRQRSVQLSQLAPLTTVKGASFYSLQMGEAVKQISATGISLHDFTSEIKDFADTAALIENLDLVISVDTSVAHLAGTMQKKVWLLLPYTPDWRWLLERADSSWYPTMRLFRQTSLNDWQDPISRMTQALAEWVNT